MERVGITSDMDVNKDISENKVSRGSIFQEQKNM